MRYFQTVSSLPITYSPSHSFLCLILPTVRWLMWRRTLVSLPPVPVPPQGLPTAILNVREWYRHDAWRPVPKHLVRPLLHLHLRDLYPTPAGSGLAQAWDWECKAGRAAGPTWSCAGACACTGSQAWQRDQTSLSLGPYERKWISWVWLCAQTGEWRGALRSPRSGTTHTARERSGQEANQKQSDRKAAKEETK